MTSRDRAPSASAKKGARARKSFLAAVTDGATVIEAAELAGVDRRTLYRWRDSDDAFRAAWDQAYDQGTDRLEREAERRALNGSDTLLIFLMKGRRPQRFRDNAKIELAGSSEPVKVEHEHRLTLDDLAAYVAKGGKPADSA